MENTFDYAYSMAAIPDTQYVTYNNGKDAAGNYFPNDSIKRSEACVIFTRIALSDKRAGV